MTHKEILKRFGIPCKSDEKRNCSHMTSKEAFEKIIELCNHYQHTIVKDTEVETIWGYPIDNIRKDLEILEIIKKSITDKYLLCKRTKCLNSLIIGLHISEDTDLKKIKEWLENE